MHCKRCMSRGVDTEVRHGLKARVTFDALQEMHLQKCRNRRETQTTRKSDVIAVQELELMCVSCFMLKF
jgi:hypothetical protein